MVYTFVCIARSNKVDIYFVFTGANKVDTSIFLCGKQKRETNFIFLGIKKVDIYSVCQRFKNVDRYSLNDNQKATHEYNKQVASSWSQPAKLFCFFCFFAFCIVIQQEDAFYILKYSKFPTATGSVSFQNINCSSCFYLIFYPNSQNGLSIYIYITRRGNAWLSEKDEPEMRFPGREH